MAGLYWVLSFQRKTQPDGTVPNVWTGWNPIPPLDLRRVNKVRTYIREKKIYCGPRYREVDIFPYTEPQKTASSRGKRAKKKKESEPKQKNLNEKNARRYFTQLGMLNFENDPGSLHITSTYKPKFLPETVEEAEREITNYIRRLSYVRKKRGLSPLKYLLVTAYTTGKTGDRPVRIHHHLLINGGLERDVVEELWRKRKRKGECEGERIGFCNADRLQGDENGIAALCHYLVRQSGGKKRWTSSHNLERPVSRTNDWKYSRRMVERWARERPGRAFWEGKYPGWTLIDDVYGVTYEYNEYTGWSIYLRLRKRE